MCWLDSTSFRHKLQIEGRCKPLDVRFSSMRTLLWINVQRRRYFEGGIVPFQIRFPQRFGCVGAKNHKQA
jgi:hypothetical protein